MWQQIRAIAWAQLRTSRNHLPRTNVGAVLLWLLSLVWYGVFAALGVLLAVLLPRASLDTLREWLPIGLLGVFAFWQLIPLFTLSTGWSLQLNKLQIYPVSNSALFGIEVLLRFTTAPEMVLVLAGAFIGLMRHPHIPILSPLYLLLFIPLNLFLSLAIRNLLLYSFKRNRFREIFAILLISIGVLPQFLIRTGLGHWMKPYVLAVSRGRGTPWREIALLSSGSFSALGLLLVAAWILASYAFAKWQFDKSLVQDEQFRPGSRAPSAAAEGRRSAFRNLADLPSRLFSDPLAALVQKEFQSLLRMPRFRVILGMACVFGVIVFVPIALNGGGRHSFMSANFLPLVNLYGLLLLSDVLLLNVFGFDRQAAQIYFVTPVPFDTVLKAKNLTAVVFIILQSIAVLILAALIRISITPISIGTACAASAVVGIFLLAVGNLSSIAMPRPIDPTQTFRKQSGGKMQFWVMLCSLGMFLLIGFAFLARWALQTNWALLGVLLVEALIGVIIYRLATESAVQRGLRDRERMMEALSKGVAPVALGM